MTLILIRRYFLIFILSFYFSCGESGSGQSGEGETGSETEALASRIHQEVITEDTVNLSAKVLWKLISDFGGIKILLPELVSSVKIEGQGNNLVRTLVTADGLEIVEKIKRIDSAKMQLSYNAISGLPADNYIATLTVTEINDTSAVLSWISEFDVSPENEGWKDELKKVHEALFMHLSEMSPAGQIVN